MVVSINGGTTAAGWFMKVHNGQSYQHGWFRGTPISGNLHMYIYIYMYKEIHTYVYTKNNNNNVDITNSSRNHINKKHYNYIIIYVMFYGDVKPWDTIWYKYNIKWLIIMIIIKIIINNNNNDNKKKKIRFGISLQ